MLEILYVGRALGYREAEFPAKLVDEAISFTIQHYQAKKDTKTQESKPESHPSHSDQKLSSQSATNDVFEDDDEEEEQEDVDELKKSEAPPKPAFKPSMLIDVEMNRPMELEPIVGAVLDRARSKAIETPRLDL
jgi:2-dehydropantoate 2-reductase